MRVELSRVYKEPKEQSDRAYVRRSRRQARKDVQ